MELQGLGGPRRTLVALLVALLTLLASAARAPAATSPSATNTTPVLITELQTPPPGYRLTAEEVERIATRAPKVRKELRRHPSAVPYEYTKGPGRWQVSWFSSGRHQKELLQVYVEDATGKVTEVWTGFQVAWTMARGYPGAFGRRVNAWYVWVPMCVLFMAPFLPSFRRGRRRLSLLHLDLAMLLAFSASLAFFNHALIGISVPLVYPFLLYLLIRMLGLAFGRGRPREPLRLLVPVSWLAVAVMFGVGFRVGLNVVDSNVIDVGYAGVIGADKVLHGKPLYGGWPRDNASGDTYGPVNYYAYVPFRAIFGWSGTWDDLPASHAAAIAFDLLTLLGLFLLGRRIRGPTLGILLAYAWVSYPFTLYVLSSNSNDSLVAMLVVAALLTATWAPARRGAAALAPPIARGAVVALATLTKFAPALLAPLLMRGTGPPLLMRGLRIWPPKRALSAYLVGFGVTLVVAMLPVLLNGNLTTFWRHTVSYQANRSSPFSIWGLWGGLGIEQHLVQGAAVGLAVAVAFFPRARRNICELAALGAAVLIALQLGITHWFYLYIVWFFPLVMVALLGFGLGKEREPIEGEHRFDVTRARRDDVEAIAAS